MRAPCIILCLIGVYISVLLLQLHNGSMAGSGFIAKTCEKVGGCHQVLQSKWAYFPPVDKSAGAEDPANEAGSLIQEYAVPVALLGLAYFAGLLIWFTFVGRSTRIVNVGIVITSLLSCLGSVWFLYLMKTVIGAACPFCLISHAVNFLLLGAILNYFFRSEELSIKPRELYGATAVAMVAVWAAIGFGWRTGALSSDNEALTKALTSMRGNVETVEMVWRAEEPVEIAIRDNLENYSKGQFDPTINALPGFRNTVVVFADAECPACMRFHKFLFDQVRPYYGGHLRIIWKHNPLGEIHPNAWKAARVLEAARIQGKFWVMLDALHEYQGKLDQVDYVQLAVDCGMNPDEFNRDVRSREVQERIEADAREAERLGLDGTPAVFLNNRRVDGTIRNLPGFWKLQASRLRELRIRKEQGWGTGEAGFANRAKTSSE